MGEGSLACPSSRPDLDSAWGEGHSRGPCRVEGAVQGGRGTWGLDWGRDDHAFEDAGGGPAAGTERHDLHCGHDPAAKPHTAVCQQTPALHRTAWRNLSASIHT